MEDKLAPPAAGQTLADESQAPTIAASSISNDDKSIRDDETPAAKPEAEKQESSSETAVDEKKDSLARQATSTSKTGAELQPRQTREDGAEYPTGLPLALICIALCLSVFVMALDNSIISTAIPKITDEFGSLNDVAWYGSAYMLTTAALQLFFGRLYTFFSIKWVFLIAIFIFEVGSLICAVAPNSNTLIVGRAIAGVGSAGIFSGALTILAYTAPLEKRPLYTGLIGSMYGVSSVAGPLLGGAFTDRVTWRWCFYINLPIGAVAIAVIIWIFDDPKRQIKNDDTLWQRINRFDPFGTAIFMPAIICLLLALQWGGSEYPWSNWRIILLFTLAGVLLILFVFIQHRQQDLATVPPRIFLKRTIWSASFFIFCVGGAFLGTTFYLPIWFQSVKGATAVGSGIMNLPMLIATVLFSVVAGALVTIWGYFNPFMIAGTVLMSVGFGLITTFTPTTAAGAWIGYQILIGVGIGISFQQPLMAAQTVLSIEDVPTGMSLIIFVQTLGGALFIAVSQNIFTNRLLENVARTIPEIPNPLAVLRVGATAVQTFFGDALRDRIVEAYNDALVDVFFVYVGLSAVSILGALMVEWKSVKGKGMAVGAA